MSFCFDEFQINFVLSSETQLEPGGFTGEVKAWPL